MIAYQVSLVETRWMEELSVNEEIVGRGEHGRWLLVQ